MGIVVAGRLDHYARDHPNSWMPPRPATARLRPRSLPLVYDELRKLAAARMAAEAPGHTLNGTALVHEAYLRLIG